MNCIRERHGDVGSLDFYVTNNDPSRAGESVTFTLEFDGEDGGYHMNIPLKWGIDGGPYTHDAGHVVQTVSVQTNGTVSVSKFGITARRKPNEDCQ